MEIEAFAVHALSEDVALATYRTTETAPGEAPRRRLRSSIWVRRGGRWTLRFHQGTPAAS